MRARRLRSPAWAITLAFAAFPACDGLTDPGRDPAVIWTTEHLGGATGVPYVDDELVAGGVVFTDSVFAVARETGETLWVTRLTIPPDNLFGDRDVPPNLRILAFEDLLIFAVRWIHAVDRNTGAVVWSFMPNDWPGRQMVLAGNQLIGTGQQIYSLDPATGEVLWQADVGELPSEPIYEDGVLYFGARRAMESDISPAPLGEGHAMAVDAETGSVLWKHLIPDHPTEAWLGGTTRRGFLTEELFIVAGRNGRVHALDRETGEPRWVHDGPSPYNTEVAVIDGVAVVGGTSGVVEGIDLETGELRWSASMGGATIRGIGHSGSTALAVAGRIYAFDPSGEIRWGFGGAGWNQPTFQREPVVRGGVLYAASVQAGIVAVRFPL